MESKRESILKQKEEAELKVKQYENKIQLLENRKKHLEKKADRQPTHHLCNMGGAIQSISKEADSLTRVEFYSLMEQVFALPECRNWWRKQWRDMRREVRANGFVSFSCRSRLNEAKGERLLPVPPIVPVKNFIISGMVKLTITPEKAVSFLQKLFCRSTHRKDFMTDLHCGMRWNKSKKITRRSLLTALTWLCRMNFP